MKDVILLADPNSKAWEFAKKIQKYIKETKENLHRGRIKENNFEFQPC